MQSCHGVLGTLPRRPQRCRLWNQPGKGCRALFADSHLQAPWRLRKGAQLGHQGCSKATRLPEITEDTSPHPAAPVSDHPGGPWDTLLGRTQELLKREELTSLFFRHCTRQETLPKCTRPLESPALRNFPEKLHISFHGWGVGQGGVRAGWGPVSPQGCKNQNSTDQIVK